MKSATVTSQVAHLIKPILKRLHPDLFYRLSSAVVADGKSIADFNKECIQQVQDTWQKVLTIESLLPLTLISSKMLTAVNPSTEKKTAATQSELERKLQSLNPAQKFQWNLPPSAYFQSKITLRCYYYKTSDYDTSATNSVQSDDALSFDEPTEPAPAWKDKVNEVLFTLDIPKLFTNRQSPLQQVTNLEIIQGFTTFLEQQKILFESLHLPFPLMDRLEVLQRYIQLHDQKADTTQQQSSSRWQDNSYSQEKEVLSPELLETLVTNHKRRYSYKKLSQPFVEYLAQERTKLLSQFKQYQNEMEEMATPTVTKGKRNSPARFQSEILTNTPDLLFRSASKLIASPIVDQINYYFAMGHIRFQRIPEIEEVPLLFALHDFFCRYADVLHFDYRFFARVYILVTWNHSENLQSYHREEMSKKQKKATFSGYSCKKYTATEFRKYFPQHQQQQHKRQSSNQGIETDPNPSHFYLIKIPHNFEDIQFVSFLRREVEIDNFTILTNLSKASFEESGGYSESDVGDQEEEEEEEGSNTAEGAISEEEEDRIMREWMK